MNESITHQVFDLPLAEICCDADFNCRGQIAPMDVAGLCQDIEKNGLQFPICVQPAETVKGGLPARFKYRIVAGHRRYTAFKILGRTIIPAIVRSDLDEIQARALNLSENLNRENLNILQEAKALQAMYIAGCPREQVGKMLGVSGGWVQVRYSLLKLPEEIQQEAAAGILNQQQIKLLCTLKTDEQQYEAVRKIKEAKARGEKPESISPRKKKLTTTKKPRTREEGFDMIEIIAKSGAGYGLHTRAIAWMTGEISSMELFDDIQKLDPAFVPPMEF
jgi:ParB family chromosome partitioning protein